MLEEIGAMTIVLLGAFGAACLLAAYTRGDPLRSYTAYRWFGRVGLAVLAIGLVYCAVVAVQVLS